MAVSSDGRYVAYESLASNLVAGDNNGVSDVFLRDAVLGTTTRVSLSTIGIEGNADSWAPSISSDGRYVAFYSDASNLVAGDSNNQRDVFVRDVTLAATTRVSVANDGSQSNGPSYNPSFSANGQYVTYTSGASNLISGDSNDTSDVYRFDRNTSAVQRVSVGNENQQGNGGSYSGSSSADGRYIAFVSDATNLGWTTIYSTVYLRDTVAQVTTIVSAGPLQTPPDNYSFTPRVSDDGRFIVYTSLAHNVAADTNYGYDIIRWDRILGNSSVVSVGNTGLQGQNVSTINPTISSDGSLVAFSSNDSFGIQDDNSARDIFLRDNATGSISRASTSSSGSEATQQSARASLSSGGQYVGFGSCAPNLVPGDNNGLADVFLKNLSSGATTRVSVNSTGQEGNGTSAGGSEGVMAGCALDATPPVIDPLSIVPFDFGHTMFGSQPLLARIWDEESAIDPGTISFTLRDETAGVSQTFAGSSVSFDGSTSYAKTLPATLSWNHLYRIEVRAKDLAGNLAEVEQARPDEGGGFLASSIQPHAATASIPSTSCTVGSTVGVDGMKSATCAGVVIQFAASTVDLGPIKHVPETSFIEQQSLLTTAIVRTSIAGATVTAPAYRENDPNWAPRTVAAPYTVTEALPQQTATVSAKTIQIGTLVTRVPATWTSATLEMSATATQPSTSACSDPVTSNTIPHCSPDALLSRYIVVLQDNANTNTVLIDHQSQYGVITKHVFDNAIKGYSAWIPRGSLQSIGSDSRVKYVVRSREFYFFQDPDDEIGLPSGELVPTGVDRINADGATSSGSNIDIALIDSGISSVHPDLAGAVVGGSDCTGSGTYDDENGHGSRMAGIIGARQNGVGIVGVAPATRLWSLRVGKGPYPNTGFLSNTVEWDAVVCALDFVDSRSPAKNGPIRIANISIAGRGTDDRACGAVNSDPLHAAICKVSADGVVVVAAAGNVAGGGDDVRLWRPASYDEVIAVSSLVDTDGEACGLGLVSQGGRPDDTLANYSNFASRAEDKDRMIAGPGEDILSSSVLATYSIASGTSDATAHVTGWVALYAQQNPSATLSQVLSVLRGSGEAINANFRDECTTGSSHVGNVSEHPEPVARADDL